GQQVARMTDPLILSGDVRDRIENIVSISPVADLMPLLQTSMND
ncbi:MAG TPA: alpha/beta hydrolase, partial [Sulfitobacter pontiacus]|nr:alpha/beta hydrolase [Sulfitobacter pontiacus]